jgi:hypothetical protein
MQIVYLELCTLSTSPSQVNHKEAQWEFSPLQETAMDNLKQAVLTSPALQPINHKSNTPIILSVNTSHIAIGFILS